MHFRSGFPADLAGLNSLVSEQGGQLSAHLAQCIVVSMPDSFGAPGTPVNAPDVVREYDPCNRKARRQRNLERVSLGLIGYRTSKG